MNKLMGIKVGDLPFFNKYKPTFFKKYYRLHSDGDKWTAVGKIDQFSKRLADVIDSFFIAPNTLFYGVTEASNDTFSITIKRPTERLFIGSFGFHQDLAVLIITHTDESYIELLISDKKLPKDEYDVMESGGFDLDILFHRTTYSGKKGDV